MVPMVTPRGGTRVPPSPHPPVAPRMVAPHIKCIHGKEICNSCIDNLYINFPGLFEYSNPILAHFLLTNTNNQPIIKESKEILQMGPEPKSEDDSHFIIFVATGITLLSLFYS